MANPTQAQIDKLTTNATRWDNIINGAASTTVALDTFTVKTVAGYLQELQATNPRGAWGTGTVYALKDVVVESSIVYICTIAHTGGTFATDLAAGKWAVYQLDVTSAITFGDDFTVDTNTLHVDSTDNRVGIGTTSFISTNQAGIGKLSVVNDSFNLINTVTYNNGANVSSFLGLTKARGTQGSPDPVQDGDLLGAVFGAGYNGSNYVTSADIRFLQEGTLSGGKIIIRTTAEGTGSPQDRFCIDAAGNVGIGTTSPDAVLQVNAATGRNIQLNGSSMEFHTVGGTFWQGVNFVTSDGVNRGGLFAFGGSTSISYFNIGSAYNDGTFTILPAGRIGMGTNSPNSKAKLDITSTTQGFLPPRMNETQRDAISTPPAGLIIYNTTSSKLNLYTSSWEEISST